MRILDLSPSGWSVVEVTLHRLVLIGAHHSTFFKVLRTLLQAHLVFCLVLIRVSNAVDTMCSFQVTK